MLTLTLSTSLFEVANSCFRVELFPVSNHEVLDKVQKNERFSVRVKWSGECLDINDAEMLNVQLKPGGNWNPKVTKKGGWREYLI